MFFFAVKSGFNGSNVYVKGICTPELEIKQLNLYVMWKKKFSHDFLQSCEKIQPTSASMSISMKEDIFSSLLLWSFQVYVNTILRREDTSNI